MYRRIALAGLLAAGLATFAHSMAVSVEMMGVWQLNTAKTKYKGARAPKQMTVTYTLDGNGWRYEASGVSATGEPIRMSYTYAKDGTEIPTTGFPWWDTMVIDKGAMREGSATLKRHGAAVGQNTHSLSADLRTLTIQGSVTTPEDETVTYLEVYEKR